MKTIGFIISSKENERRRCLLPTDIVNIKNKKSVFIETGYGDILGFSDDDYLIQGIKVCSREDILKKDIICDPKVGDSEYLLYLQPGQLIFGWIHAVQNRITTNSIIKNNLSAIAWEDMYEYGRHVFYRNNEIAGEAAIMHAYSLFGLFPYNTKVAILGKGNVARGAMKILTLLGAEVNIYDKRTEELFRQEINQYDVVVNAILWDTKRTDHILYKSDLKRMKKNSMIIDVSCDNNGGIETSKPTTIKNPTYFMEGICHYAVDHTPTIFYKTISSTLSNIISKYIDLLIIEKYDQVLKNAVIIKQGNIIDQRIIDFQKR